MGRSHGTWAQWFEDVHDHPKTMKLAAALVKLGVPEEWATDAATGALHRLACWALRDNEAGVVGHLTPLRFAQIARWPWLKRAQEFWQAFMDSGFIDDTGTARAAIHDFDEYFWHVLRFREQCTRPARATHVQDTSTPRGETVPRTRRKRAHARAAPDTGILHTPPPLSQPPPPTGSPPDGGSVCVSELRGEQPGDRPPDDVFQAAWNRARAKRRIPPEPAGAAHLEAWSRLLAAADGDLEIGEETIEAYVTDRDPKLAETWWSINVFPHRLSGLVAAVRKRRDDAAACRAAAAQAEEERVQNPPATPEEAQAAMAKLRALRARPAEAS